MSQNDFNIANQGFPSFRSDLNGALQALASNSAGTSAPATTYAYMWWYDSTNNVLKMRNADNDAWINFASFNQATDTWSVAALTVDGAATVAGDLTVDTNTLYVDSTNNRVGIGTSNPSYDFQVGTAVGSDRYVFIGSSSQAYLQFKTDGASGVQQIIAGNAASGGNSLAFYTAGGGTEAERMRIDASGNLLVGTAGTLYGLGALVNFDGGSRSYVGLTSRDTDGVVFLFTRAGSGGVGSINVTASATSYNTSSDYRLKEDWQPMTGASERVLALKPCNFAWKATGVRVDGFLAHEAQAVVPEAVTGTKDAMREETYEVTPAVYDDEGNLVSEAVMGTREVPDYQGIDQSKLVPLLTAALQEALTEIAALKDRVAALEA